ncbi:cobalamin biosynthesis protein CobG [Streptomyces sp. ZAF1911]|uniref:cobalamin biosynthesis protein CobG n=1 Tax=Streptomyces sp. ZAF1911 TaxID=2944129 RepID=UPI00237B2D10|nr:cobalamin biosynthesis protein CobG [Streptomyces sp. ZAF1911]MDD9379654.1 cobalamin biosynthesis protein CobG [Streptomyces sp. ZAF1911]
MPTPPSATARDEPVIRDRGDACPGALRLHAADDGYLARVRIPGGLLTARQASVLALAADRFGDGHLELTSRGNVQLRGLAEGCGAGLAELLDGAGLLPAPGHERVRNIVATPLSGILSPERPHVTPWVGELDRLLCASTRATALSGRFLFAIDDGRGDVAALDPDVTLLGAPRGRALVRLGAAPGAVEVDAADAPRAALLAAEYFLDSADAAGTRAWRVSELPPVHALEDAELAARLGAAGIAADLVPEGAWPYAPPPKPWGPGTGDRTPLCVLPPLGRLTAEQWRLLVRVADDGGLRITPWRSIVLPRASTRRPVDGYAQLEAAGLSVAPDGPWESVTACTGRPGCAKALSDVRADARAVVAADHAAPTDLAAPADHTAPADHAAPAGPAGAPVHWSGCERRCGHPRGTAWVDLVATPDGYRLDGRPVPSHELAQAVADARSQPRVSEDAVKK